MSPIFHLLISRIEHQRIDAFELWCWRRLLGVPWTARRANQSILKEISSGCSLEGLMLKLKLQYLATSCEELTHWTRPWCWERLGAGREGDDREWDGWMASRTQWTGVSVNSPNWWWTGRPGVLQFMGLKRVEHDWVTELNWIEWGNKKRLPSLLVSEEARWEPWTCTLHDSKGGLINEGVQ